ncbi:aldo/keto reductase [Enterobacteriaceae bacterium EKM102V]|uniref:aldo/keto reductase n=1 Tax=Pantoea TaxID=53335 RepID=UPI00142E4B1C|nr:MULTISPECIES: aldo/keto reductase [Pantoea]KAF6656671.1 aldo/keto reductase [Enterobacteriaceae bacterium EKM102V]KAF6666034.1 aldo/keto reductase [Pantoea sp. EKM103V]
MIYSHLGKSGLVVSRIALGCMSFGESSRGAHPWTLDFARSERIIVESLDSGINFFDTANIYSLGSSEEILGECLKRHAKRDDVVIATKVYEKMSDSPQSGGLSRKEIFSQVDQSLKRLQTDYIDLYIIHRWDPNTPIEETMSALNDLVRSGKVRYIGASSMRAWQFIQAQNVAHNNGWTPFISMQNHYNLINREEEREMLPYCVSEGIGVTPWSPLARGRLAKNAETARSRSDKVQSWLYESAKASDVKVITVLNEIARNKECKPAHVALAWLLSRPGVASPIIGATSVEQLTDNIRSVEINLDEREIAALEEFYTPHATAELQ